MFQQIILVGNLGKEPEMRYTPSGQPVTNFSMATSRKYESSGQNVEETCWFKITVWGNQAEACNQYLHKGSKVLVEGRLVPDPKTGGPRIWNRQDGTAGASFEVTASTVRFLSSKGEGNSEGEEQEEMTEGERETFGEGFGSQTQSSQTVKPAPVAAQPRTAQPQQQKPVQPAQKKAAVYPF